MAVSSGGEHWIELLRLRPAWADSPMIYASTDPVYAAELSAEPFSAGSDKVRFHVVPDANRWQRLRLLKQLFAIAALVLRYRPDVIITTGAAPGNSAIRIGALIGSQTIWVDSIANGEELSMSGQLAGKHAEIFLTRWPRLAKESGHMKSVPSYWGAVE